MSDEEYVFFDDLIQLKISDEESVKIKKFYDELIQLYTTHLFGSDLNFPGEITIRTMVGLLLKADGKTIRNIYVYCQDISKKQINL